MSQKSTRLEAAGVPDRDWETDLVSFPLLAINQLCELGQKKLLPSLKISHLHNGSNNTQFSGVKGGIN